MKKAPAPGIYTDIGEDDYFNMDAVNASLLKSLHQYTPAHAREYHVAPRDPTPAMVLGSAAHAVMLQPELFEEQYACGLTDKDGRKLPRRSADQKAQHAAHQVANEGKVILDADDFHAIFEWRDRVLRHPLAADLLEAAVAREVTAVWTDEETGLPCKARIDALTSLEGRVTVVADLKTTQDASPHGFARSAARFNYHIQAAHYLAGLNALEERERIFLLIAVEKDPPYAVAVHELSPDSLQSGAAICRRGLRRWHTSLENDHYPGYSAGANTIELPSWALDYDDGSTY